jgi:hypothetical protein
MRLRQDGRALLDSLRTSTRSTKNKHGRRAFGTSFNNRDEHCKHLELHAKSLGEEDEKEVNVAALEVHQRGEDFSPHSN